MALVAHQASAQITPAALSVAVEPASFSPNGDGRQDDTTIRVDATSPTTVQVEILDAGGRTLRSWTQPASPESPALIRWDGKADAGLLADGDYLVRAQDTHAIEPSAEVHTEVTIDTRAPKVSSVRASPSVVSAHERISFRFVSNDRSSELSVNLRVDDWEGAIGGTETTTRPGASSIAWEPQAKGGRPLYPGTYFATIVVEDDAGNVGKSFRLPWRVHREMRARVWRQVPGAGPRVAITIDDCHFETAWRRMLSTLRDRRAGATFFCPGKQILLNRDLVRRTIAQDHAIGSHGWDHSDLRTHTSSEVVRLLEADADLVWQFARRTTAPFFRPPYGAYDREVIEAAGRSSHPRVIMWDVSPGDTQRPGVSSIVRRVVTQAERGSIVLLHTLPESAEALPAIISGLRDRGLEPVGLPELFRAAGMS